MNASNKENNSIRLAVLADFHLNARQSCAQYAALTAAIDLLSAECPDAVISLGDSTASGEVSAALHYMEQLRRLNCPVVSVPGNSDLRTPDTVKTVRKTLTAGVELSLGGWTILGLDNGDGDFTPESAALLERHREDDRLILCMHIPQMLNLSARRCLSLGGHYHNTRHQRDEGREMLMVRACDPDKALFGPPALTIIELKGDDMSFREIPLLPVETDISPWFGFSCYRPLEDVELAIECGVNKIEFRPDVIHTDPTDLLNAVHTFRQNGGNYVSLHLPDMPENGPDERMLRCLDLAGQLNCDGVTVHIPNITPQRFSLSPELFSAMAQHYAALKDRLPAHTVIGIENMHTKDGQRSFSTRRYGCDPAEMKNFLAAVHDAGGDQHFGLLLDVGHARNNMPLSQEYPVSYWYAAVGQDCLAYHIHQMDKDCRNHMPIRSLNSVMINYTSFLWAWENGLLNHRPCFIEVNDPEGKRITLRTFRHLLQKEDNRRG